MKRKIFSTLFRYEPKYLLMSIPQIMINSCLPLLYVWFPKHFIELLTARQPFLTVAKSVSIFIAIITSLNLAGTYLTKKSEFYANRFAKKVRQKTGDITMSLSLEAIEGTEYKDKLALANSATQITGAIGLLQRMIANSITIAGLTVIIIRLDMIFLLVVAFTLCMRICLVTADYRHNKKQRLLMAKNERKGNYLNYLAFYHAGAAKEIRTNHARNWFMSKVSDYRNEMLGIQYKSFKRYALHQSVSAVVTAVQSFIVLFFLAVRFIDGIISIADFTMYYSTVTTLTASLSSMIEIIGEYMRLQVNLGDFDDIKSGAEDADISAKRPEGRLDIVFTNVSFKYPNSDHYVLKDINITIPQGEKLAVVGQNGAGKTTFIKLLCRFYKPTDGTITLGGTDIWEISQDKYYQYISAVFQDYKNFAFSVSENITLGLPGQDGRMEKLLAELSLDTVIQNAPQGIHTYLTRNFDQSGIELSGGENQKLAIARAAYKDSAVLILDEPTASLDPKAENEIYQSFLKIAKGKTTIFISHRLASSAVSDRIAVFDGGRITELGSHAALMQRDGLYAQMFQKQSEAYLEDFI